MVSGVYIQWMQLLKIVTKINMVEEMLLQAYLKMHYKYIA